MYTVSLTVVFTVCHGNQAGTVKDFCFVYFAIRCNKEIPNSVDVVLRVVVVRCRRFRFGYPCETTITVRITVVSERA